MIFIPFSSSRTTTRRTRYDAKDNFVWEGTVTIEGSACDVMARGHRAELIASDPEALTGGLLALWPVQGESRYILGVVQAILEPPSAAAMVMAR